MTHDQHAADSEIEHDAKSRLWWTNDVLAFVLTFAFIGYVFAPMTPYVGAYPEVNVVVLTAFVTAFGSVVVWSFGADALRAWRNGKKEE